MMMTDALEDTNTSTGTADSAVDKSDLSASADTVDSAVDGNVLGSIPPSHAALEKR